jgi:type IV pilus assembly protein PilV
MSIPKVPIGQAANGGVRVSDGARAQGFTLIEVMVSLVILSMGLLGIAKLVLFSAHSNDSAYLRSQATDLAYAILDDMRGNRAIAMAQGYDVPINTAPAAPGSCVGTGCSPGALATYDVNTWLSRLALALPAGTGSVTTTTTVAPAPAGTTAVITVQWDDSAAQSVFSTGPSTPMSITLETVL